MKPLRQIVNEDWKENKEKYGTRAEDYAAKIKTLAGELCKLTNQYDIYELKSISRELEDMCERLDCSVDSRKKQKEANDKMNLKSNSVYEEEGKPLRAVLEGKFKEQDIERQEKEEKEKLTPMQRLSLAIADKKMALKKKKKDN